MVQSRGRVSLERQYRLYRFYDQYGLLLYVGITGRRPFRRLMEHVCDKPWAGEMARWEVDPGLWTSEADVLRIERHIIRGERPRYNVRHNEDNPDRVWAPPTQRQPGQRPSGAPARRSGGWGRTRRRPWWQRMARTLTFRVAVLWIVLAGALSGGAWWAADRLEFEVPPSWLAGGGAVLASAIVVRWWRKIKRKLRRRR